MLVANLVARSFSPLFAPAHVGDRHLTRRVLCPPLCYQSILLDFLAVIQKCFEVSAIWIKWIRIAYWSVV